jgi:hypothetical protein
MQAFTNLNADLSLAILIQPPTFSQTKGLILCPTNTGIPSVWYLMTLN